MLVHAKHHLQFCSFLKLHDSTIEIKTKISCIYLKTYYLQIWVTNCSFQHLRREQKKKKRLKTISALIWLHYCTHSTCMTEERSQHWNRLKLTAYLININLGSWYFNLTPLSPLTKSLPSTDPKRYSPLSRLVQIKKVLEPWHYRYSITQKSWGQTDLDTLLECQMIFPINCILLLALRPHWSFWFKF